MVSRIKNILKTGRVAFVGVGNVMRADDGVGPYIISRLKQKLCALHSTLYAFIDAGQMPENYIGVLAKLKPDTVIIIDALDFKTKPGLAKILDPERIKGGSISTHGMPLNLFAQQVSQRTAAKVLLVGIQPQSTMPKEGLTGPVKAKADELIGIIIKSKPRFLSFFYGLAVLFFAITMPGCGKNYEVVKQARLLMGTTVEISVADADLDKPAKDNAIDKAFARIREIEGLMSSYKKDSEVSRINSFADVRPVQMSCDTIKVIKRADELNKITEGAFDITVGPLVELWGFGPKGAAFRISESRYREKIPQDEEIKERLKFVGMDKVKLDYAKKTIRFAADGVEIDLGGIAEGYAVDCAIQVLKENGVKNAMVNAGGDIFCMGRGLWGRPWKVGIQHPREADELLAVLALEDKAVATSGDYQRYFLRDKKRVSHIIDPRTGESVADIPASVTIIAPDCMTADGLSTAIFVLGPEEGFRVLNRINSVEAMIAVDEGKYIKVYETDGFGKK